MLDVMEFFQSYPLGRETLCSEPVADCLRARGCRVPFSRRRQLALWRRGMLLGLRQVARRIGAREIHPRDARDGDVALIAQEHARPVLAMRARHAYVAASFGRLLVICDPVVIAAWRIG